MTRTNNIHQHILRTALCLALTFCTCLGAWAQTWDGKTATVPTGTGTADDPFIIATAENLYYVAKKPGEFTQKYLKQTADIDLGGKEWTPIGNTTQGFGGYYNGMSHAIKGLRVDWGNYAMQTDGKKTIYNYAYGLFGYLCGSVENLIIDGASICKMAEQKEQISTDSDLRVAILAGSVGCTNGCYIKNILIRNSSITDSEGKYLEASAYMIGALVGDLHNADDFASTNKVTSNFEIKNIYVEANISVKNTILKQKRAFGSKGHQFYVGGLIGRARSVLVKHMPKHVLYTGKIDAPLAMVGPIFAGARAGGQSAINTYVGAVNSYAGDFYDSGKADGNSTADDFPNNFYTGFYIQNYSDGSAAGVTTLIDNNASLNGNAKSTRTLKKQATINPFEATSLTAENMAMFQGVNRGTCATEINADILGKLNTDNGQDFRFVLSGGRVELQGKEEIVSFERKSIFKFEAKMRSLKASTTYIYKWTIWDKNGNSQYFSIHTDGTKQHQCAALKILSYDKTEPSCAIMGDFRQYSKIQLEVLTGTTLIASASYEMGDVDISMVRDIYTTTDADGTVSKEHFLIMADVECDGHRIATEPDFFEDLSFKWEVQGGAGFKNLENSEFKTAPTGVTPPAYEAHIKSTYVGNIRLTVTSKNPEDNSSQTLTNSVVNGTEQKYIEQVNTGLHLSLTMEECTIDATTGDITTYVFNPADYYPNTTVGNQGFYDKVDDKFDPEGSIVGGKTSVIKPLIFKVKVVDQFGNDWSESIDALSHYRIQWNYRISGEGLDDATHHQFSTNYDYAGGAADGNYNIVNGRFDASKKNDTTAPYGLEANIADRQFTDYLGRKGHVKLINDSILIIHPNILHRTSAFWVRVRLFDIEHDAAGAHPVEEILSFNQLGIKLSKNTTENTLEGKVVWKLDPDEKTYVSGSSGCDLYWYESTDPTDPDKWVKVQEKKGVLGDNNARYTMLDPEIYDPTRYYKLYYKSGFDLEAEEIIGPKNVVYVYDRAMTNANLERTSFNPYDLLTNEYYPSGLVTNHGHDPYHAVRTMEQAYKLLPASGTVEENIIVVMGYMEDDGFLGMKNTAKYNRRATITGKYGNISGSTVRMAGTDDSGRLLGAPTAFKDLNWYSDNKELHFYCGLNDVTFDTGVKMMGYKVQGANTNGLGAYTAPSITIIAGFHNNNDPNIIKYPVTNADTQRTTMTFRSGAFARIISGARNSGGAANDKTKNVFGSPKTPHRVKVVVDINEERPAEEQTTYPYDIGLLVGGQTDGTLYAESEIEMRGGTVGRYISGNISYGRTAGDQPSDSFFGSTTLNLYGGEILELYGGTLGRHGADKNNTAKSDAYFYGRSIINIYDGTINSDIFGAGAGGVTGLGDATAHTSDNLIPYYNSSDELKYGDYATATGMTIPTMTLLEIDENRANKVLDFANSYVEVNVMGGTVNGNIYGGGYGYSSHITADKALEQAGWLFGNSFVNISGGLIDGNVYGGGAGSDEYNKTKPNEFKQVACVYGNTSVKISGGTITGNIYGGGQGILGYEDMAKVTGNTSVEISGDVNIVGKVVDGVASGGHVYGGASLGEIRGNTSVKLLGGYIGGNVFGGSEGDASKPDMATVYGKTCLQLDGAQVNASIYGGCNVSSIRKPAGAATDYGKGVAVTNTTDADSFKAMTKVIINSGTIGNNIYGGSRGNDAVAGSVTDIEGDTYVRINGGSYKNVYYLTNKEEEPVTGSDGKKRYRDFNVFGGGEKKCIIAGTAHLDVRSGLMNIPGMQDFYAIPDGDEEAENTVDDSDVNIFIPHDENPNSLADDQTSKFQGPYMDLTYRRFSLYGGGYGEHTNCLNTDVYVYIPTDKRKPHGRTLKVPYDHQSYFDIAGGGYSGDIGYWANANDTRVAADSPASDYHHYVGGDCKVTIDGYTYCRKVIGGGFYGSCNNTDTKILCGSLRQVYGGSLLGYVHGRAKLDIGNNADDAEFIAACGGDADAAKAKAKELNDLIYFTENVYGGNDVKGIVGTTLWVSRVGDNVYGKDREDGGPLWMADVNDSEVKGVVMNIYGGRFMGDVYGAGNGHYRGYYVPGWLRYEDGPARMYRTVKGIDGTDCPANPTAEQLKKHRVYRARPMVGSVNINLRGNSEDDYIKIDGNFYGGGRECTIGQWRTILPFEDPRRLSQGGHLHVNVGGHVYLGYENRESTLKKLFPDRKDHGNFYMGVEGRLYAEKSPLPDGINLSTFDGSTTEALATIGDAAYDHWYFNTDAGYYKPGFPAKGTTDGNFDMTGEHMFRGYMKNIEMQGDVELTFYRDLYKANGERKRWVPGEVAVGPNGLYNAQDITMTSFFLGGKCGSMTNNNVMIFCYKDSIPTTVASDNASTHDHETFGSIYRITMPQGVTIKNLLVMGAEDATITYGEGDNKYVFEGGMVTQSAYSFDYIAYNLYMKGEIDGIKPASPNPKFPTVVRVPDDFYDETPSDANFKKLREATSITLKDGVTVIYRKNFEAGAGDQFASGEDVTSTMRLGLAITKDAYGNEYAYIGDREYRSTDGGTGEGSNHLTVSKLTAGCEFAPQIGNYDPDTYDGGYENKSDVRYGGIIYGGCYNSGVITGDVIMNVGSNMLGRIVNAEPDSLFGKLSTLKHYIGRVYGGGYGKDSRVDGNVYVNLVHNVKAMNVFGGGMLGDVTGDTHINYIGNENSYIYGAIYGGGFQGSVGRYYWRKNSEKTNNTNPALLDYDAFKTRGEAAAATPEPYHLYVKKSGTYLNIISGNVDHVYGGSCMGDVYGATDVKLYDEVTENINLDHLDYSRLVSFHNGVGDWGTSRLIAGTVFGGNDISGNIIHTDDEFQTVDVNDTNVEIKEEQGKKAGDKNTPGANNNYNGFPLVGNLYGGSNGNYGTHGTTENYASGSLEFATGDNNTTGTKDLTTFSVPHIGRSSISIKGGTVVNAYGGGDMSTVTERDAIQIAYNTDNLLARAGFATWDEVMRVWHVCHLASDEQINEVLEYDVDTTDPTNKDKRTNCIFRNQVYRVFGGNNNADMAIQPTWDLTRGYVGNVYSGGNFGKMTYCKDNFDGVDASKPRGLELIIDKPQFHAEAVYGGGRVGDIDAGVDFGVNEYGATLHIVDGVIDHVYGGNDVSGVVRNGTHVIVEGAISGDVYCAGNGNYRYQYDATGEVNTSGKVEERYDDEYGGRYFILPQTDTFGNTSLGKLQAINYYRPNVSKTWMTFNGRQEKDANGEPVMEDGKPKYKIVYVRGNVYCGGNSAALSAQTSGGQLNDIKFEINDHVRLNSVFLGSNGESLLTNEMIAVTEKLNNVDFSDNSGLTGDDGLLYPHLLDVYLQAVESKGLPTGFELDKTANDAYIGDFFLGGNRGSMMTDRTIKLEFPENLVIFGKIVGGSQTANFEYTGKSGTVKHIGGLNKKLDTKHNLKDGVFNPNKVELIVKSKFEPWYLEYPKDGNIFAIQLKADENAKFPGSFSRWRCNIYGGCFNSGRTVGDISIDLYSDLIGDYDATTGIGKALVDEKGFTANAAGKVSKKNWIINGINREGDDQHRTFSLIGGGYGEDTDVYGNIRLRMLPFVRNVGGVRTVTHPSAATVFGGSQDGRVVGNTLVELRDGTVFTNLYGASEATPLYGSSQIIIGWPEYYKATANGTYIIDKVDKLSDYQDSLKNTVSFRAGDIVSKRVYDAITHSVSGDVCTELSTTDKEGFFAFVNDELPTNWNDIDIHVGDNASLDDENATYYGHGNVYGGGFISQSSATGELGAYTVRKFPAASSSEATKLAKTYEYEGYTPAAWAGLGGNSMILVWDNKQNTTAGTWHTDDETNPDGHFANPGSFDVRDHISIGTGRYKQVTLVEGQDVLNYYKKVEHESHHHFVQQSSHRLTAEDSKEYYEIESDGGIYGDGRMVYVEGLRVCDLAYYGYAGSRPQYPKMLNTFQRLDLLSVTDCCLRLEGAQDIVTNGNSNPTKYSITRIGELQMFSSINSNENLDGGIRDASDLNKVIHNTPRTRNYMAFGHGALYLGAIKSNVDFETAKFHEPNGTVSDKTYKEFKKERIDNYYVTDASGNVIIEDGAYKKNPTKQTEFEQRNMGTAANMIGINNGYSLHIKGLYEDEVSNTLMEYAGPAIGVFEVKLLTLTLDEGGGYIYALNKHNEAGSRYHFLETPGNFVYAGAEYKSTPSSSASSSAQTRAGSDSYDDINFIYDDCVPMGQFEKMTNPNTEAKDKEHVWYVNGSTFFFNASLTAYTGPNTGQDANKPFILDNISRDIYLYGVEAGQTITVEEVTWTPNPQTGTSDIQDYHSSDEHAGKDYKIYVSVGDDKDEAHSAAHTSDFVARVSRSNYDGSSSPDDKDVVYPGNSSYLSSFQNKKDEDNNDIENQPYLGITLIDNEDNSTRDYFNMHLAKPEKVRITLKAEGKDASNNTITSHYNIDLDIHYLLSPIITGNIVIENGALPGEYIFANAFDVNIDKDDNILISDYDWYVAPKGLDHYKSEGALVAANVTNAITSGEIVPIDDSWKFSATDNSQIHIPAARYMDGWGLIYAIKVDGNSFYRIPATDADGLNKIQGKPYKPALVVHNYHRMLPTAVNVRTVGSPAEDLKITAGARIYIEDDIDMAHFYKWLAGCQAEKAADSPKTLDGQYVNPRYGEGLTVYLMNDVKLPTGLTAANLALTFKGTFHGNGHTIDMNGNDNFLSSNDGKFYNTGFIFDKTGATAVDAFDKNNGTIQNCFYYNKQGGAGTLFLNASTIPNVERNVFEFGKAAYDLNGFYLEKRNGNDESVIKDIYEDGEYRYALVSVEGGEPSALRKYRVDDLTKNSTPNYLSKRDPSRLTMLTENYGTITGFDVTMHNDLDPIDHARAIYNNEDGTDVFSGKYAPRYNKDNFDDYKIFGQLLGTEVTPTALTSGNYETNRVYRAGGFYGTKYDEAFHFNRDVKVLQPTLTAINFNESNAVASYPNTEAYPKYIYYPQTADMPTNGLNSFWIDNSAGITHNLLVYDYAKGVPLTDASVKMDYENSLESDINVHVIDKDCKIEHFHLVDALDANHNRVSADFNAPIAFNVTKRAWYERWPLHYASRTKELLNEKGGATGFVIGKDAWEGISLPFFSNRVKAISEGHSPIFNRGEISHFYGNSKMLHDYWLRGLVGTAKDTHDGDNVIALADFARPGSKDSGLFDLGEDQDKGDYIYDNDWLYITYANKGYVEDHNAYGDKITFKDCRFLSKNAPYIVAFPGKDYYEFDLSGVFYNDKFGNLLNVQKIVYENKGGVTIKVTDEEASKRVTTVISADGIETNHYGTFAHIVDNNFYVLNDVTVLVGTQNIECPPGSVFIKCKEEILPFRTYLTVNIPPSQQSPSFIMIGDGTRSIDSLKGDDEKQEEKYSGVNLFVRGSDLVVTSDHEFTMPLYGISGQLYRSLPVRAGKNVYHNLNSGVYMALGHKFVVRAK